MIPFMSGVQGDKIGRRQDKTRVQKTQLFFSSYRLKKDPTRK